MTYLPDDVLRKIAENGRAYWNESRDMAKELLERRQKEAAQLTKTQPIPLPGGLPFP